MLKKILVTGAGGFIGGFIVEEALRRGYETWAGVRASTNKEYLKDENIKFIDLKFNDKEQLKKQLSEQKEKFGAWDYIVHNLGVTKCKNPEDFDLINYGFVKNFTEALIETETVPKQFIMMSSLGAWGIGDETGFTPIRQSDVPHPNTRYGKSKLKAEQHLYSLSNFPYVIMRPTGVYGPREKDYYLMMKTIKFGFDFSVGYKKQLITFIYVRDLVKVIFLAIDKGVKQRGYFISDGGAYTSTQFRKYIASAMGKRFVIPIRLPLVFLKIVSYCAEFFASLTGSASTLNRDKYNIMKQRNWICDITPLQKELGFEPDYPLEKGVYETVNWYKKSGWL